jgi:hypothetical protein
MEFVRWVAAAVTEVVEQAPAALPATAANLEAARMQRRKEMQLASQQARRAAAREAKLAHLRAAGWAEQQLELSRPLCSSLESTEMAR